MHNPNPNSSTILPGNNDLTANYLKNLFNCRVDFRERNTNRIRRGPGTTLLVHYYDWIIGFHTHTHTQMYICIHTYIHTYIYIILNV